MSEHPLETRCARCDKRLRDHFFVDCCEDETPRPDTPRFLSRYRPDQRNAEVHALRERLAAAEKRAETAEALVRELAAVAKAAERLAGEPDALGYPVSDYYGMREKGDEDAPLWTECGLYGRVGKEAARTLLVRHRRVVEALAALSPAARKEIER